MPSSKGSSCVKKKGSKTFEAHYELLARTPIAPDEKYDYNYVFHLLSSVKQKKPSGKCKLQCIANGVILKKTSALGHKPHRKFIPYVDIERFYSFSNEPNILVLGCRDAGNASRHYEFYKLGANELQEFCNEIEKAHDNPAGGSLNELQLSQNYQSSHSSLIADMDKVVAGSPGKSSSENALRKDLESTEEVLVQTMHSQPVQNNKDSHHRTKSQEDDPLFALLSENVDYNTMCSMDLKYINVNPSKGNQIAAEGSVYLFVAHHRRKGRADLSPSGSQYSDEVMDADEVNPAEPELTTFVRVWSRRRKNEDDEHVY